MNDWPPQPSVGRSSAVGRFNPDGPTGFRHSYSTDAPIRATRVEAECDALAWKEGVSDA